MTEPGFSGRPHHTYPHVLAVVRLDDYEGVDTPLELRIQVVKVFASEEEAHAEQERLNQLSIARGSRSRYHTYISKYASPQAPGDGSSSGGTVDP